MVAALKVGVAPALILVAGIGAAAYVLRAPLHVPVVHVPPPSLQPRPSVAATAALPVVTIPPAPPAPAVQPVTFVTVTSAPSGAEVRDTNGHLLGRTPLHLRVPSGRILQITVRRDGYRPVSLSRKVEGEHAAVSVTMRSAKSGAPESRPQKRSTGYKDDPY